MSEALDDWTYHPERDDEWLDARIASMDRGEWYTHEQVMREAEEILAEAIAAEAAREKAG
jgi:hypothetical protein